MACLVVWALATTHSATIPFDPSHGLVVVDAVVDGVKGRFGIDTGADFLYLDRKFALEHGLKFTPNLATRGVAGVDGTEAPSILSVGSLTIGEETVENISARAIDLDRFVSGGDAVIFNGLIGGDVLRHFFVTVDYPNHTLELTKEAPRFLKGKRFTGVDFRSYQQHIIVDAVIDDTVVPMLFDYCASITILTPTKAAELNLPGESGRQYRLDIKVNDQLATEDVVTTTRDLAELKKSMPRADFEGILGSTFLRDHKITIDYSAGKIYIHHP